MQNLMNTGNVKAKELMPVTMSILKESDLKLSKNNHTKGRNQANKNSLQSKEDMSLDDLINKPSPILSTRFDT
jgi:hypothetical protein